MGDQSGTEELDALEDQLRSVVEEHPVRLAVLFGSTVRGERHPRSDVDVAVEFERHVPDVLEAVLALSADLSEALDTNDVDVSVVDRFDPRVGRRAFSEGRLVLGSAERFQKHRRAFERLAAEEDRAPPAERFDAIIERMDEVLEG